jgi:hypothetical protein
MTLSLSSVHPLSVVDDAQRCCPIKQVQLA